jgi:hypothetical protein
MMPNPPTSQISKRKKAPELGSWKGAVYEVAVELLLLLLRTFPWRLQHFT